MLWILVVPALILLLLHWGSKNAVWGTATLGFIIGIIIAFFRAGFQWQTVIHTAAIAVYLGTIVEWLPRLASKRRIKGNDSIDRHKTDKIEPHISEASEFFLWKIVRNYVKVLKLNRSYFIANEVRLPLEKPDMKTVIKLLMSHHCNDEERSLLEDAYYQLSKFQSQANVNHLEYLQKTAMESQEQNLKRDGIEPTEAKYQTSLEIASIKCLDPKDVKVVDIEKGKLAEELNTCESSATQKQGDDYVATIKDNYIHSLLQKKCMRELRLRGLKALGAPDLIIEPEKTLLEQVNNELMSTYSADEIKSQEKQVYISYLKDQLARTEETHVSIVCGKCEHYIETDIYEPEKGECSMHGYKPRRIFSGELGYCEDFKLIGGEEMRELEDSGYVEEMNAIQDFLKELENERFEIR